MKNAANNSEAVAALKSQGVVITKRTTLDKICEAMTAAGYEFYYEWARELKADVLTGRVA